MSVKKTCTSLVPANVEPLNLARIPSEAYLEAIEYDEDLRTEMKAFMKDVSLTSGFGIMTALTFLSLTFGWGGAVFSAVMASLFALSTTCSIIFGFASSAKLIRLANKRFRIPHGDEGKRLALREGCLLQGAEEWNRAAESLNESLDELSELEERIRKLPEGRFRDKRLRQYAKELDAANKVRRELEAAKEILESHIESLREELGLDQEPTMLKVKDPHEPDSDPQ